MASASAERSDREYPSHPIAGVGVIVFRGAEVLLVRRGNEPRRGEWSIPGGAVEVGETAREAARREFREECGGEIRVGALVDVVDIFGRDEQGRVRYQYLVADFLAEWVGGVLHRGDDAMEARWFPPDELDRLALPSSTRAVIDKASALRRHQAE